MVYLQHFGLREVPFRITPDTEYFFSGAKRGATLEALVYAITHDEGIVKVTGEVGSGKTMLCRMLLEKLPGNVETVYLANPMLSRDEILFAIADELGISLPEGRSHLLLRSLHERLLEIYAGGRQVVALIDEAHAMPPEALEEVRQLSNLESNQHKLLQIVLFGQPELDARLQESAMRQLNERITHHFRLQPLQTPDVGVYLMFRLRAAGYHGPDLFSPAAVASISNASQGLTRRINILADKAMLAAYSAGRHQIGRDEARSAINDAKFAPLHRRSDDLWKPISVGAGIVVVALVAYQAGSRHASLSSVRQLAAPALLSPTPGTPDAAEPASTTMAALTPGVTTMHAELGLAQRLAATEQWLQQTPDDHYFIQLLLTDGSSQREVIDFISQHRSLLDPAQLRVYRSRVNGKDRLGVIYGDFPSREQAGAALAALAAISPASKPYVREVRKLRRSGFDQNSLRQ